MFGWLFSIFNGGTNNGSHEQGMETTNAVNPANGIPMANESIDVMGNPYGTDLNRLSELSDPIDLSSSDLGSGFSDDSFGGGGFDDSFGGYDDSFGGGFDDNNF